MINKLTIPCNVQFELSSHTVGKQSPWDQSFVNMSHINFPVQTALNFCKEAVHLYFIIQNLTHIPSYGPGHAKTCLMSYANNKGADQPTICAV